MWLEQYGLAIGFYMELTIMVSTTFPRKKNSDSHVESVKHTGLVSFGQSLDLLRMEPLVVCPCPPVCVCVPVCRCAAWRGLKSILAEQSNASPTTPNLFR